jgi:hypothetical protein
MEYETQSRRRIFVGASLLVLTIFALFAFGVHSLLKLSREQLVSGEWAFYAILGVSAGFLLCAALAFASFRRKEINEQRQYDAIHGAEASHRVQW